MSTDDALYTALCVQEARAKLIPLQKRIEELTLERDAARRERDEARIQNRIHREGLENTVRQRDEQMKRAEQAEAACAAMREALERIQDYATDEDVLKADINAEAKAALASDAGAKLLEHVHDLESIVDRDRGLRQQRDEARAACAAMREALQQAYDTRSSPWSARNNLDDPNDGVAAELLKSWRAALASDAGRELLERVRRLEALRAYADHTQFCATKVGAGACDCGYAAVLEGER